MTDDFDDEIAAPGNRLDDDFYEDDDLGGEGNRIVGGRARTVAEHIARALADEPDAVEVDLDERRGEVAVSIHTAPGDVGRLIGRRGRVIQAVRQVVRAAGASEGVKVSVDVVE
ncbi:MAG: KH domain-containing protein [Acidimicrobiia bacterium]